MDFSKFIDWIKLPAKYLFAISIATGILLFSDQEFLVKLGLLEFKSNYNSIIGAVFLISSVFVVTHFIIFAYSKVKKRVNWFRTKRRGIKRLKDLTHQEKGILSFYIDKNTRTQSLDYTDGRVSELEWHKIIYRTSQLSKLGTYFDYNIQPWAWDYLKKHRSLLK